MPNGKDFAKVLHEHVAMTPELAKIAYPLDRLFNMNYTNVSGDTVYFEGVTIADVGDGTRVGGACDGSQIECVDSTRVTMTIDREFDKLYKFDNCRVDHLQTLTTQGAVDVLSTSQAKVDRKHLFASAKFGVNKRLLPALTPLAVDGLNIVEKMNAAILKLQIDNPEVDQYEYVILATHTTANLLGNLKSGCCDFVSGLVPNAEAKPPIAVQDVVIVPDVFLNEGGTQYEFAIYIKAYVPYFLRCAMSEWHEMTNEFRGYIGYTFKQRWDVQADNFEPDTVTEIGYKCTFVVTP
jgi:hypothetical protein